MDNKLKTEFEQLKKDIFSEDWELVKSSAKRLGKIGGDEVINFLTSLLEVDASGIRNRAALALEDIRDNRAVEPLLKAIFKRENHNYNGTMVFALESLDCSKKLKEIFRILFYETYEAKLSAYAILDDQTFDFTKQDLLDIQKMWLDCNLHPETCPGIDDKETREMMQTSVDDYLSNITNNAKIKKTK
jgi:HEAT repeat protein